MQTIKVAIELDPVNDGAVITSVGLKRKDEGGRIIATNGEKRIADVAETQDVLDRMNNVGYGEYMGKSDYLMMINGDKILNLGIGKCFIGSAVIMKYDGKGLGFLSGDEFDEAAKEFESRLITIVGDGQEFSAYELL